MSYCSGVQKRTETTMLRDLSSELKRDLRHNKDEPMQKLAPNRRTNNTLHNDSDADHVCSPISFAARSTCLYIN